MTSDVQRWVLRRRPAQTVTDGDLELVSAPSAPIGDGQVRVRTIYLSIDPTHRIWMSERKQYLPPIPIGGVVRGSTIGVVVESRASQFVPGEIVSSWLGYWESESVVDAATVRALPSTPGVPLSAWMSVLGGTGLTAWFGINAVAQVQPGEVVTISAAAGAVGSIAGQLAQRRGARVIGIAGGEDKCRWIVDTLGFDGAVDYKAGDIGAQLDALCPDGIDVQFENVGGAVMDAVFARLNVHARVVLCGLISGYNDDRAMVGPTGFEQVLMKRLRIEGLLLSDHFRGRKDALAELVPLVQERAIVWRDHMVEGLPSAVEALQLLFSGRNDGKVIVHVGDE